MLRFLSIKRLAIIDSLEVEFDSGFNVLTGETGAGKSILIGAVGLLLGGRASTDLVRTGEDSAVVEAVFDHRGIDVIVRRELTAQGRTRVFVDGTLATTGALRELAGGLIELHGQHEHQTLLDPSTHLGVLDGFGQLETLVTPAEVAFHELTRRQDEVAQLERAASDRAARQELVDFQLGELDRAALRHGEDEELATTRQVLVNADRINRLCLECYGALYESDQAILGTLGGVWRRLAELGTIDRQFGPYLDARDGIKSQLEDLALFLRRYADTVEASPPRLQQVEDRLALLERLKRKHGPTLDDVIARRAALSAERSGLADTDQRLAEARVACSQARREYEIAAGLLSKARREAATRFCELMEQALSELAMEGARLEVRFSEPAPESGWTPRGFDRAEFFLSANVGEGLRPLARIVSGGELSRIMLAIKTLLFTRGTAAPDSAVRVPGEAPPGLIFDEVDAGIGGRVADVVGRKLRRLGAASQVLCITHLPQIAAYADAQFRIEKQVEDGRTRTAVRRLDDASRVDEIARMLGGSTMTEGLRQAAVDLLNARNGAPREQAKGERQTKGESESPRAKDRVKARRP